MYYFGKLCFSIKKWGEKYELTIAHCLVRKGKAHVTFFAPDAVPVILDRDHGGGDNDDKCNDDRCNDSDVKQGARSHDTPKTCFAQQLVLAVLVNDNDDADDLNLQGHAAHTRADSSLPSGQSGIPSHTWWMMMMMMVTMATTLTLTLTLKRYWLYDFILWWCFIYWQFPASDCFVIKGKSKK